MQTNPPDRLDQNEPQAPLGGAVSEALDRLEVMVSKIGGHSTIDPAGILRRMDQAQAAIQKLEGVISKKTAEAQFEHIQGQLRAQAAAFMKALGGVESLRALRAERQPPAENTWWYLDEYLAQRKASRSRAILLAVLGVALGLGIIILIYQVLLRPDPALEAQYTHQQRAQSLLRQGQLDGALSEANQSLDYAPKDVSLLVLKGVILQKQGKAQEAQQVFAQAEANAKTHEDFLNWRSEAYLIADEPDQAISDSQAVLAVDAQSVHAYTVLGEAYELKKDYSRALDAYGSAYDLAQKQGLAQQAAAARVKMANVLQEMSGALPAPGPTATAAAP